MIPNKRPGAALFCNLTLILAGAVLFAASFPNPLVSGGFPILAWIAWVPVFWVIRRIGQDSNFSGSRDSSRGYGQAALWGALYGAVSYTLFVPWLSSFHPAAGLAAAVLQLCYMALLFPLLKLTVVFYPRRAYLVQWLLWLSYEYLRTLGFLGFPYGISGYTQWSFTPLLGISSVFGVWGVSALVLFPSVYLGSALAEKPALFGGTLSGLGAFFRSERPAAALWLAALGAALFFGFLHLDDGENETGRASIVLVQQNADPWQDNTPEGYQRILRILTGLSEEAVAARSGIDVAGSGIDAAGAGTNSIRRAADLVVWPETAFVPRIYWHLNYRDNSAVNYTVVKELMDFLETQKVPYLIGNDDARLEAIPGGGWDRVDYNGALFFDGAELKETYRKIRLVPFAEYFPYKKTFPRIYRALEENTTFWKPGSKLVVFDTGKFRFSAPICFEDSFGYLSREFTRQGADLIVNLSNDSWAESLSCQMLHLAMSVFRAAENRRSLVRATTSGQTCAISPSGKILAMAPPFTQTFLNVTVPLVKSRTLYTIWGDLWAVLFSVSAGMLLLIGAIRSILRVIKTGRNV
ncbi:apolipoprotein N-acyltransferase 1 [Spirochaetia bacterium]|nr:apolipoprotein N-acyltransferase 1 [Spirochaetia bacterium]